MEFSHSEQSRLQLLDEEIERWSNVLSGMEGESKERRVIEAKLADWKQRRDELAALFVARVKHERKSR